MYQVGTPGADRKADKLATTNKELDSRGVVINVNRFKIIYTLYIICIVLLVVNLVSIYLDKVLQMRSSFVNALVYYFDAGKEQSIPTLFSSLLLFISSLLLFSIYTIQARNKKKNRKGWLFLAGLFIFLLLDEAAGIHEQFNRLRPLINDTSGAFYYAWIIPYAILALVIGLGMLRFLLDQPPQTRNMFIVSGSVYILAAAGFEILEGVSSVQSGVGNLNDKLLTAGEEFLEMIGITLFIQTLFQYISRYNVCFAIPQHPEPRG